MSAKARGAEGMGDEEETNPGLRPPSGVSSGVHGARGFSAELRGVGLWDLVQMECFARTRAVIRVVGDGGTGHLYFDRGRIVHATCLDLTGEAAALEILGWSNGSFQPADRPWPSCPTIDSSPEALILEAAKLRDERARSGDGDRSAAAPEAPRGNLVAFPAGGPVERTPEEELDLAEIEEETMSKEPPANGAGAEPNGEPAASMEMMLRIGRSGAIVSNRGGTEEMADTVAYVHRLAELAGELLGLEELVALECIFTEGRCIVFPEATGELVALRPRPESSLQALRERLGL